MVVALISPQSSSGSSKIIHRVAGSGVAARRPLWRAQAPKVWNIEPSRCRYYIYPTAISITDLRHARSTYFKHTCICIYQ